MIHFFKTWVKMLLKIYPIVLLGSLVLGAFSLPKMVDLLKHISTDPVDLLPSDYPSVQNLLKIREKVESKSRFALVFESNNPENTKRFMADLKSKFLQDPQVGKVEDKKLAYQFFDQYKLLFLELEDLKTIRDRVDRKIQHTKLGGFYVDFEEDDSNNLDFSDLEKKYGGEYSEGARSEYYQSPDGKIFTFYLEPRGKNLNLGDLSKFQNKIEEEVRHADLAAYDPTLKVHVLGTSRVVEYRALVKDLKRAGIIAGILIFLPLLIRFRKPQYVLLVFLPLALGIPISLALASIWVPKLNVTTSFLFAILGGLGVETGIHLMSRYYEKRHEGLSQSDALLDLYLFHGPAVLTSVASLAVTFLLLLFSDFRGFSEFGLISGLGLWVLFLLYFTFFPALLIFAEKIRWLKVNKQMKEIKWSFSPSPVFVKTLLLVFTVMTLFSIIITPWTPFEYNAKKIRADDPQMREAKKKQRETSGKRVNNPAVLLVYDEDEAKTISKAIEDLKNKNPLSTIDTSRSYYSLVPESQPEKMVVIEEIKSLLADDSVKLVKNEKKKDLDRFKEALNKSKMMSSAEVPAELFEFFEGKKDIPGKFFFINAKPKLELDDGKNAMAFAEEIGTIKVGDKSYHPSSDAVVYGEVLRTMFRDSKKVLAISVACIFFFVFLDFRNLKKTFLVMFSILAGVFWVFGVMYLTNIKLNLYNMVLIPSIMGMSIDNSIHVYHRYEELGKGSLAKVLSSTGISALLASMTNAAGFIGLLFCHHGGLRSMGVVACIGLVTCLISTLVFMPMILQFFEWRKNNQLKNIL